MSVEPMVPNWVIALLLGVLSLLVYGYLVTDWIVEILVPRLRRRAVWRELERRRAAAAPSPDPSTERGVNAAAFHLAPRS